MKFRILLLSIAIWTNYLAISQRTVPQSDSLRIFGQVMNPTTFSLADLDTFPTSVIKDQIMFNQNGEVKDTLTGMIGIPLKALLSSIQYRYDKPRELNEFYFIFTATDSYRVVFSWNEIYNTEAGNHFFIVTELEGKKIGAMEQRILFISSTDLKIGRRFIKGLSKIEVQRLE